MKKTILSAIALIFFSTAYSQYFTVKIGGGNAWPGLQQSTGVLTFQPGTSTDPANASIIPLISYNTTATDTTHRYKSNVYSGYGSGGHLDFAVGYMINPYFGVEIDGAYLWGRNISAVQNYDAGGVLGNNTTITTTTHSNGLSLNPSLVFRAAKAGAKVAPYARLGIALPVSGAIYHTLNIQAPNSLLGNVTSSEIDVTTKATVSVGFQGNVGVSYSPIPLLSIFGEVNGQYLFVRAKNSTLTKYNLNIQGKTQDNLLDSLSTYSKVTNYVDQLNVNSNTTIFGKGRNPANLTPTTANEYVNEKQAQDELRQVANLGSFGFTVGIVINMSKKIFQDPAGKKARAAAAAH